jgi:hypothetical protein
VWQKQKEPFSTGDQNNEKKTAKQTGKSDSGWIQKRDGEGHGGIPQKSLQGQELMQEA